MTTTQAFDVTKSKTSVRALARENRPGESPRAPVLATSARRQTPVPSVPCAARFACARRGNGCGEYALVGGTMEFEIGVDAIGRGVGRGGARRRRRRRGGQARGMPRSGG